MCVSLGTKDFKSGSYFIELCILPCLHDKCIQVIKLRKWLRNFTLWSIYLLIQFGAHTNPKYLSLFSTLYKVFIIRHVFHLLLQGVSVLVMLLTSIWYVCIEPCVKCSLILATVVCNDSSHMFQYCWESIRKDMPYITTSITYVHTLYEYT